MHKSSVYLFLGFISFALLFTSCSVSPKNTDLLEYGYKGEVKSVKSTMYYDVVYENDEWVIDESKIGNIRTVTFNEDGNIVKAVTTYPQNDGEMDVTYFQFEDGRKSSFYKLNAANDTLEKAVYEWISETEYIYTSVFESGATMKSVSKLNSDLRDLSGGYSYKKGDSTLYAKSYVNTLKDNLITTILMTDDLTKKTNKMTMTYSNFDEKGNPLRLEMLNEQSGLLENLSIREYEYF